MVIDDGLSIMYGALDVRKILLIYCVYNLLCLHTLAFNCQALTVASTKPTSPFCLEVGRVIILNSYSRAILPNLEVLNRTVKSLVADY